MASEFQKTQRTVFKHHQLESLAVLKQLDDHSLERTGPTGPCFSVTSPTITCLGMARPLHIQDSSPELHEAEVHLVPEISHIRRPHRKLTQGSAVVEDELPQTAELCD